MGGGAGLFRGIGMMFSHWIWKAAWQEPEIRNYYHHWQRQDPVRRLRIGIRVAACVLRRRVGLRSRLRSLARWVKDVLDLRKAPFHTPAIPEKLPILRRCSGIPQPSPDYFFPSESIEQIAEYVNRYLAEEREEVIRKADGVRRGVFPLASGVTVDFSLGVNWTFPTEDREHLFCLNRWAYGVLLGKATAYTGDASYVEAFLDLFEDWVRKNPTGRQPAWESYSVSERICNWTFAHHLFLDSQAYRERGEALLRRQLYEHAVYLREHLETRRMHNHLINNARALFTWGTMFPDMPEAEECRDLGWEILVREMPRQVLPDGMFREQSSHYHLLLTRTFTEVYLLALRNGVDIPAFVPGLLQKMHEAATCFVKPAGGIVQIGDVSPDIESRFLRGIPAVGVAIFSGFDPDVPPNEYAVWYLRPADLKRRERGEGAGPKESGCWREGGYAVLRGETEGGRSHLVVHCDPVAAIPTYAHGHNDLLSFELSVGKTTYIADPGLYSYRNGRRFRALKGGQAHNTVLVDGLEPAVPIQFRDLFEEDYGRAEAEICDFVQSDVLDMVACRHSGYTRLPQPVRLMRRIAYLKPDVWIVSDFLEGEGTHQVEVLYHHGACCAEWDEASGSAGIWDSRNPREVRMVPLYRSVGVDVTRWRPEDGGFGGFSKAYGHLSPCVTTTFRYRVALPVRLDTVIYAGVRECHTVEQINALSAEAGGAQDISVYGVAVERAGSTEKVLFSGEDGRADITVLQEGVSGTVCRFAREGGIARESESCVYQI